MRQLDIQFTVRRLLSKHCGHEKYQLDADGELRLALLPLTPVQVSLVSVEEAENRQRSILQLTVETPDGPYEELVDMPVADGDCWTVMLQLKAPTLSMLLVQYLNPYLVRVRSLLKDASKASSLGTPADLGIPHIPPTRPTPALTA